jgi:hypothetical protein
MQPLTIEQMRLRAESFSLEVDCHGLVTKPFSERPRAVTRWRWMHPHDPVSAADVTEIRCRVRARHWRRAARMCATTSFRRNCLRAFPCARPGPAGTSSAAAHRSYLLTPRSVPLAAEGKLLREIAQHIVCEFGIGTECLEQRFDAMRRGN